MRLSYDTQSSTELPGGSCSVGKSPLAPGCPLSPSPGFFGAGNVFSSQIWGSICGKIDERTPRWFVSLHDS